MDQTAKTNQDLLLVIDMQNVYTKGQEWACEEVEKASDSILRLLNSRALSQVIFTQYLDTKHPEGVWKEYNKVNAAVNADPWLNEMMSEFLPYTKKYPVYTKSVYSSFAIPQVRELAKHASRVVISGVVIYLTDAVAGLNATSRKEAENILSYLSPLHTELMTTQQYLDSLLQEE